MAKIFFLETSSDFSSSELWTSDGTPEGTHSVKSFANAIFSLLPYRDGVVFQATDGVNGFVPWFSDGTPENTYSIDINPTGDSFAGGFRSRGNLLYFSADDGTSGSEVWVTDGTEAGTHRVTDVNPGIGSSDPGQITFLGDQLFFTASPNFDTGIELFVSDGIPGGDTHLVEDFSPNAGESSQVRELTPVGSKLFFAVNGGVQIGTELGVTDGTAEGTKVIDINPGFDDTAGDGGALDESTPTGITAYNGYAYFNANGGHNNFELWRSDGTEGGTRLVKDIVPGEDFSGSSNPTDLTVFDERLYFTAQTRDTPNNFDYELWVTDGTTEGTQPFFQGKDVHFLTTHGGYLYFAAGEGTVNGAVIVNELWRTDGTAAGTELVKAFDIPTDNPADDVTLQSATISPPASDGDFLYFGYFLTFVVGEGPNVHSESQVSLYRSDGSDAGTVVLATGGDELRADLTVGVEKPAVPSDFDGDGKSDILFQNLDGAVSIWELDGTQVIGGQGPLVGNPGPDDFAIAAGDFNGDRKSDVLFQNIDGAVSIRELSGTHVIGGEGITVGNPGPDWYALDTGDFNGDDKSDILFQHTSGFVSIWELDGTDVVSGAGTLVGANPGPDWLAVGTGDFNDDGLSDILFQHTSGFVSIWELDGTKVIAGQGTLVGANPGPDWLAVGTGDFNDDGKSDILFQHESGAVSIWELNGTDVIGGRGTLVGANPGSDWHAVTTGDYNGDGKSDILFQHESGAVSIWELNGTDVIGGVGTVVGAPDASWLVV